MKNYLISSILIILISFSSFAGDDKGNGGNAVICYSDSDQIKSAELLDFYEAGTFRFIFYDLETETNTLSSKINLVTSRLEKFSPDFAANFKNMANQFLKESLFLRNIRLTSSEDSFHYGLPEDENCKVQQVIHQNEVTFPEDFRYIVNLNLWEKLDINHQVGLIFHEVIYGHTLYLKSSKSVRYFNSIITSVKLNSFDLRDFIDLLIKVGFKTFAYYGYSIDLSRVIHYKQELGTGELYIHSANTVHGKPIYPIKNL